MTAEPRSPWTCTRAPRARVGGRRAVQHAEGPALEPHHGDRDVLHLDPLVGQAPV